MPARIVLAAILLSASPALAQDPPLPELTPKGEYRVMTRDDASSTSDCIGNPVTPLCAVETVMACDVRHDYELCRIGMGLKSQHNINRGPRSPPQLYRVVRTEVLTEEAFPWRPTRKLRWRPGEPSIRTGDIRIDLRYSDCEWDLTPEHCPLVHTMAYIVRQEGDRWAIIMARDPKDPRIQ